MVTRWWELARSPPGKFFMRIQTTCDAYVLALKEEEDDELDEMPLSKARVLVVVSLATWNRKKAK